jgi:predicted  nucleic acid-binding Zn-ribbon protein
MLKQLTDEFDALMAKLNALEEEFQEAEMKKKRLQESLADLQVLIDRGDKLVQGLSGEKTRWEA